MLSDKSLNLMKDIFTFSDLVDLYVFEIWIKGWTRCEYKVIAENLEDAANKIQKIIGQHGVEKEITPEYLWKTFSIKILPLLCEITGSDNLSG